MKLGRRDAASPADELKQIRRELPRAQRDLAAIEDDYLDGVDEAQLARERAEFDAQKVGELREQERLRLVVDRLRARGADLAEESVLEKERAADAQREDLRRQHAGALANVRRLEALLAGNEDRRFEFERERFDARSEFTGRKRDWAAEDDREVRRWVDLHARGLDRQQLVDPPTHLRERLTRVKEGRRTLVSRAEIDEYVKPDAAVQ